MPPERVYKTPDGRTWTVTLEAPGRVMSVAPELENSGAMLPEHALRIFFRSGDDEVDEEYTALTPIEDLSDDQVGVWYDAARRAHGL